MMPNAKIAPGPSSDDKNKEEKKDVKKEEEEKKKKKKEEEEDYLTRKCGWMCCGLCTDEYKTKRPVGTQFSEKTERKVTDCICLLIFAITMVLWGLLGIFASQAGEPERLIYGRDLTGELCSRYPNANKDYLYYPRLNEDLLESLADLGTDWEGVQDAILTGGLDLLAKVKLTGVCVERCPYEGEVVCTRDYLESRGVTRPEDLSEHNDVSRCKSEMMFPYSNERLCSSCWVTPLNTTEIFNRCLEIVMELRYKTEKCVNPKYDPDDPNVEMTADDPRCLTKETTYTEIERKSAYPNPVAEYLGEAVQSLGSYIADVERSYDVVLVCGVVLALTVGFVWLLVLQKLVGYIVWGTIFSYIISVGFASCYFWYKAGLFEGLAQYTQELFTTENVTNTSLTYSNGDNETIYFDDSDSSLQIDPDTASSGMYKVFGMIMTILEIASICLVIAWKKKIEIMIAIIKEATKALMKMPFLTVLPWFTTIQVMVLTVISIAMMALIQTVDTEHESWKWLRSSAENTVTGLICTNTTNATTGEIHESCNSNVWMPSDDQALNVMQGFHLICYLWVNQLVLAISCCTIAGAVCKWYWTRPRDSKKKLIGHWPILSSYWRVMRYHLGSLAMGSFLVALVQAIRFVCEYINNRTKKLQERHRIVRYLMAAVRCFLWCFEKSLKYITQNAYILIAMKGLSFCKAAKLSFFIIYHNMIQLAIVATMTKVVVFLGKVLIVITCSFLCYIYISNAAPYQNEGDRALGSFVFPTLLVALISYFVAQSFLQVFSLTINTIMICFIEDREANKESPKDSFYPENLYKVMVPKSERKDIEMRAVIAERKRSKADAIYPKGLGPLTEKEREDI